MIFIIPGNPGIGEFYEELAELLLSEKSPKAVHILGYSSFGREAPLDVKNIREEAIFIQEKMEAILKKESKSPVTVIGHSIGGWILQEIMTRNPDLIDHGIFLFPFLAVDPNSRKQRLIHGLLRVPLLERIVLFCYRIFHLLPHSWKKIAIIPLIKSMSSKAKDLTLEYFLKKKHIPRSVIQLARTEFATLPMDPNWNQLIKIQEKSVFIFNSQDIWAPMSHYLAIRNKLPNARTRILSNVPHDFCVYGESNVKIAETILKFLDRP